MNKSIKTLVFGASLKPQRYSNIAVRRLRKYGHEVIAFGMREGMIGDTQIIKTLPEDKDIHTVTLYMNPRRQEEFIDYILSLRPRRIIFNPGTENAELDVKAKALKIETVEACTLVMLSTDQYNLESNPKRVEI